MQLQDVNPTVKAFLVEQRIAHLISIQEYQGVQFNKVKAGILLNHLHERRISIDRKAIPQLPIEQKTGDYYKKPFLKSGKLSVHVLNYCERSGLDPDTIGGQFSRVWYESFDTGSVLKVKDYLVANGWFPNNWNVKPCKELGTRAKTVEYVLKYIANEPNINLRNLRLSAMKFNGKRTVNTVADWIHSRKNPLKGIPSSPKFPDDPDEMEQEFANLKGDVPLLIKQRITVEHRRGLLQGLINKAWYHKRSNTWRLSAGANSNATPTCRMRHRGVVNIPTARTPYGKQLRSLFISDKSKRAKGIRIGKAYIPPYRKVWIGADAAGLELRMLAHHMGDADYIDTLLNGDIHTANQEAAGLPTRDDAKTFIYGFLYGAGNAKIGEIIQGTAKDGADIKERFLAGLPALKKLIDKVQRQAAKGYLRGIDGRFYRMRKDAHGNVQTHKALNTLLQGDGSVTVKYWTMFLANLVKKEWGSKYYQHLHMHDELHYCVDVEDVERMQELMHEAMEKTTKHLNFNLPLACDPIVGANWHQCH